MVSINFSLCVSIIKERIQKGKKRMNWLNINEIGNMVKEVRNQSISKGWFSEQEIIVLQKKE